MKPEFIDSSVLFFSTPGMVNKWQWVEKENRTIQIEEFKISPSLKDYLLPIAENYRQIYLPR